MTIINEETRDYLLYYNKVKIVSPQNSVTIDNFLKLNTYCSTRKIHNNLDSALSKRVRYINNIVRGYIYAAIHVNTNAHEDNTAFHDNTL